MKITKELTLNVIYGGLLLGGGGGGTLSGGFNVLEMLSSVGDPEIIEIDDLEDGDIIITASLVGSPASKTSYVDLNHYKKVYELIQNNTKSEIKGIITNESGAQSSTNGFILSALTNIPLINSPCNGRAHPTGIMGSLGLHKKFGYLSIQAGAGGKGVQNIEVYVKSGVENASKTIRNASIEAGGFVTVLRNPVEVSYVKEHAAVGAFTKSLGLGKVINDNKGHIGRMLKKLEPYGLSVIGEGVVVSKTLRIKNGFDLGNLIVGEGSRRYEIVFWNEYMTLEDENGVRLATFPDLIAIIDKRSALPVTSAEIKEGQDVYIVKMCKEGLDLSSTMRDKNIISSVSNTISKTIDI